MFGKVLKGNNKNWIALLSLRGALMMLFFSTLSFSQTKVVKTDYSRFRINGKSQTTHKGVDNFTIVLNDAINYKIENPDSIIRVQFSRNDIITLNYFEKVDTLIIYGSWHLTGNDGNYFRYINCGEIVKIEADSVLNWQNDIEVIRTKTFGETVLKLTDSIPFQFVYDTITRQPAQTSLRWQTFATEKHCIKTFIDGIYTGDEDTSCNPGNIIYHGQKLYRHTNNLEGLTPETTYNILVEGIDEKGNINFIEFKMTTL